METLVEMAKREVPAIVEELIAQMEQMKLIDPLFYNKPVASLELRLLNMRSAFTSTYWETSDQFVMYIAWIARGIRFLMNDDSLFENVGKLFNVSQNIKHRLENVDFDALIGQRCFDEERLLFTSVDIVLDAFEEDLISYPGEIEIDKPSAIALIAVDKFVTLAEKESNKNKNSVFVA